MRPTNCEPTRRHLHSQQSTVESRTWTAPVRSRVPLLFHPGVSYQSLICLWMICCVAVFRSIRMVTRCYRSSLSLFDAFVICWSYRLRRILVLESIVVEAGTAWELGFLSYKIGCCWDLWNGFHEHYIRLGFGISGFRSVDCSIGC